MHKIHFTPTLHVQFYNKAASAKDDQPLAGEESTSSTHLHRENAHHLVGTDYPTSIGQHTQTVPKSNKAGTSDVQLLFSSAVCVESSDGSNDTFCPRRTHYDS
uniref:Uncharacterized protein n=1 Tax=Nelumbo nucifera TaxID=4432 RepID=A0A822XNL3_NELNU|nr:TPA_asm: hypothetical protein HUJ06_020571 [Nelumbo nucifera]